MPKGGSTSELTVKNFLGVNMKDAGDRIRDNELTQAQNVWQPSKGVLSARFGSLIDKTGFSLASRISGIWRHYSPVGDRFTLYHCVPDSTLLPDNTADLTLTEITLPTPSGNIFGGGAVVTLRVCYSWIGRGMEQTYNTKNRAGFNSLVFPLNASANTSHQSITLGASTSNLRVTVPAFPAGITGANIFLARGTATKMTYMGTVTTSGGHLDISEFIGPNGAKADPIALADPLPSGVTLSDGALKPGTYWIGLGWVVDPAVQEGASGVSSSSCVPIQGINSNLAAMGASSMASSATLGSLVGATQYDCILTVMDSGTGLESFVSPTFNAWTKDGQTSMDISIPALPGGATAGSTFNVYFGLHGQTLYQATTGVAASSTLNQRTLADPTLPTPPMIGLGSQPIQVKISGSKNAIQVTAPTMASTNGAKALYVFISTQDPSFHPMTCYGIIRTSATDNYFIDIKSIPAHNAQSCPWIEGPDANQPLFWPIVFDRFLGGFNVASPPTSASRVQARFGFVLSSKNGGPLQEVFPSRTLLFMMFAHQDESIYAGDSVDLTPGLPRDLHNVAPNPKTANDRYQGTVVAGGYSQPYPWQNTPSDPMFSYLLGMSYFANGADIPWQTDGYTLGQLCAIRGPNQTLLPPIPRYLFVYQSSLVASGSLADNQMYASNANAPHNWATGGSGTLLRFVTIGDAVGSGVSAAGIFTPMTEATNNPGSFLIGFKKNGTWMTQTIGDPTQSTIIGTIGGQVPTPMIQVSGRVGCVAYRSIVQTPLGTVFLGQDGNVYLINRVAEPVRIGTKIQNGLAHLVGNDTAMKGVTAVYHDNHYKISYPSVTAIASSPIINDSEWWADLRTDQQDPITWFGPHSGRNIGPQVVLVGDNDDLSRLVADAKIVRSYTADTKASISDLDDAGAVQAITTQITSKIYKYNEEAHRKRIFGMLCGCYLDYSYTNNLLLEGFADEFYARVNKHISSGGAVWDSSQWDNATFADALWEGFDLPFDANILGGRTFQWRLTKSDIAPFILESMTTYLKPEKRRQVL